MSMQMSPKILPLLLILAGILSCSTKEDLPSGKIETVESVSFSGSGGPQELVLSTDGIWTAVSSDKWCTVYPSGGSGRILHEQVITVICEPNEGPSDRGCYLILRTPAQSVSVFVKQEKKSGFYLSDQEINQIIQN